MEILFDQGTPAPLRHELTGHVISTTDELGWGELDNGDLLRQAEGVYGLLITTDQNLRYQQNLSGRKLSILVLMTTSWPKIQSRAGEVRAAVANMKPGEYRELKF